ncbi:TatD family hydrolase [bacterium]|nr:TatD family hydrolase [bacterium]
MAEQFPIKLDAHIHLDLYPDVHAVLDEIQRTKTYIIAVTNTPAAFQFIKPLSKTCPSLFPAVGYHPVLNAGTPDELELMLEKIPEEKFIGEVGLDYSRSPSEEEKTAQKLVFEKILRACAEVGDRVLTVHSREAAADVIDLVGVDFPGRVILHWYSGDLAHLKRAIDYDFYFSVNPAMLEESKGRRIISAIPPSQVLTETDGPYIKVEDRIVRPTDIGQVIAGLGSIWQMDLPKVETILSENVRRAGII